MGTTTTILASLAIGFLVGLGCVYSAAVERYVPAEGDRRPRGRGWIWHGPYQWEPGRWFVYLFGDRLVMQVFPRFSGDRGF